MKLKENQHCCVIAGVVVENLTIHLL